MIRHETTYKEFYDLIEANPNENYYVETHKGELTKINGHIKKTAEMLFLVFDGGIILECADEHAFMNSKGDSVLAKDLKINHRILTKNGTIKLVSKKRSKNTDAYDIGIDSPHWYVNDENGIIHHNTNLGLVCLKAYMDRHEDAVGLLYDSEFSFTPEYLGSFGIDQNRVFITPVTDIDQLKNDIINQVDSFEKGDHPFILIDSVGNLASLKELTDAQDGKSTQDMTRAKMLKSLFRMITPRVNLKNIPLFVINHVYETQEMYSKTIISGGTGVLLSANTALIMSRRKAIDKNVEGFDFMIKAEKSRFIKEGIRFPLTIPKGGLIKKFSGLFDLALETGFIMKEGNMYMVPEVPEFKKSWRADVENSVEFWDMMFKDTKFISTIEEGLKVSVDQSGLFKFGENAGEQPESPVFELKEVND